MVSTKKFSEFLDGGTLEEGNIPVGLEGGTNVKWTAAPQFTAPFTTATRPAAPATPTIGYNTDTGMWDYWNGTSWETLSTAGDVSDILTLLASNTATEGASLIGLEDQGSVSAKTVQDLAEATFIAQTDNGTLANAQFLSALTTGIVKNTTGTGVLSIATPGTDFIVWTWNTVNTATALVAYNGYVADDVGVVAFTLPATATVGDQFFIMGVNTGLFTVAQNALQSLRLGNVVTTVGVGGSLASQAQGDSILITCTATDTDFMVSVLSGGNYTLN